MTEQKTQEILALVEKATPSLPTKLERHTLALARTYLPSGKRSLSLHLAELLVSGLLLSVAMVFAIDAFTSLARFF